MKKLSSRTFKYALVQTLPIMVSYIFIGIAFGVLIENAGYDFLWAYMSSSIIYTGSFQFVFVPLLASGASLITVALTAILVNSRLIFFGLSFIEKLKKMGRLYPYMIYTLTDETYSIYCSMTPPDEVDEKQAMFFIAILGRFYWIFGSVVGALIGEFMPFNFEGIEFCMTALFITVFINQWKNFDSHLPAIIGVISGIVFLVLLGPDKFILPALLITVGVLLICKKAIYHPSNEEEDNI